MIHCRNSLALLVGCLSSAACTVVNEGGTGGQPSAEDTASQAAPTPTVAPSNTGSGVSPRPTTSGTGSEGAVTQPVASSASARPSTTSAPEGSESGSAGGAPVRPDPVRPEPSESSQGQAGGGNDAGRPTGEPDAASGGATSSPAEGGSITPVPTEGCESGPLAEPLPDCAPEPVPDSGDFYADCVARINQLRWDCQCLPPLERWTEGESCADQHSQYDYEQDEAHAGFSADICENGGSAQNECPDYGPSFGIVDFCLQQMWDEGPGEDFQAHGHYINMSNDGFTRVACGRFVTEEGNVWSVQNFSR